MSWLPCSGIMPTTILIKSNDEVRHKFFTSECTYWLDWVEIENDNLQAALAWSQSTSDGAEIIPHIALGLTWFHYRRGYYNEGSFWNEQWLTSPMAQGRTPGRALILLSSAYMALWRGDLKTAQERGSESLDIWTHLEDESGIAIALINQGIVQINNGNDSGAHPMLKEAHMLMEKAGNAYFNVVTRVHLGNAALGLGKVQEASDWLEKAYSA